MLLSAILAWFTFGAVFVAIMRRRGHDSFNWAVIFLFLGPVALPLALSAERLHKTDVLGSDRPGRLDVLAAHDGTDQSLAALRIALNMLQREVTSLTLATVVDVEAANTVRGQATIDKAHALLNAAVGELKGEVTAPVDTVVLYGEPARALEQYAADNGYELIVAGGGGHGRSHLVSRSVARRLATCTSIPVLIGPTAK